MSELKAYETNPFGKQEIKISVQTLKEIDLVLVLEGIHSDGLLLFKRIKLVDMFIYYFTVST